MSTFVISFDLKYQGLKDSTISKVYKMFSQHLLISLKSQVLRKVLQVKFLFLENS